MKILNVFTVCALASSLCLMNSCKKDDETMTGGNLKLNITGLSDLGSGYEYEGWLIVNGTPQSAGTFTVDGSGKMSKSSFEISADKLNSATTYIVTIEPAPDTDPQPSATHLLAGDFSGMSADLSISHGAALSNSFTAASGSYILATPTNGMETSENSGVWWLNPEGPKASLDLPTLPSGWKYEGWAVINDKPVSTGKFTAASGADLAAPYSADKPAPPFPGEDFLLNAPAGITFPTNLAGKKVVISIEPDPDNSAMPFSLKPLVADVPNDALDHKSYGMVNNATASSPSGSATR